MTTLQDKWYDELLSNWIQDNGYGKVKIPGGVEKEAGVDFLELSKKVVLVHDHNKPNGNRLTVLILKNVGVIAVSLTDYVPRNNPMSKTVIHIAIDFNNERKHIVPAIDIINQESSVNLWTQIMNYAINYFIDNEPEIVELLINEAISLSTVNFFDFVNKVKIGTLLPETTYSFQSAKSAITTTDKSENFKDFLDLATSTNMVVSICGRFIALLTNNIDDGKLKLSLLDLYECKLFNIPSDNIGCLVDNGESMLSLVMTAIANEWNNIRQQMDDVTVLGKNILNWGEHPSVSAIVTDPEIKVTLEQKLNKMLSTSSETKIEYVIREIAHDKHLKSLNHNNSENPFELKSVLINDVGLQPTLFDTKEISNIYSKRFEVYFQYGRIYTFNKKNHPNYNVAVKHWLEHILSIARIVSNSHYGLNDSLRNERVLEYDILLRASLTIIEYFSSKKDINTRQDYIRELILLETEVTTLLKDGDINKTLFDKIMFVIETELV